MSNKLDISGQKYGRLTATTRLVTEKGSQSVWECKCKCGATVFILLSSLRGGNTKSCGCFRKESAKKKMTTHGMTSIPEFEVWQGIKKRCYNEKYEHYHRYGGRGITVCIEWIDDFQSFFSDMGERPDNSYSIDRIDNDGNYEKSNCRWATKKQQARNKSNSNLTLYDGAYKTLIEWCEDFNINYKTVRSRLNTGWSIDDALNKKARKRIK